MAETRATLKGYFKKGAIPTEAQFATLIDSTLNLSDDGVFKPASDPLSIRAVGADGGLLNFYGGDKVAWQIKQGPVAGGKAGLSVQDATGSPAVSRLFLESGTGNVGVGTTAPKSLLSVAGGVAVGPVYAQNQAAPGHGLIVQGKVGLGTPSPDDPLEVAGEVKVLKGSNPIRFTSGWSGFPDTGNVTNQAEISNDTNNYKALMIVGNRSNDSKTRRVLVYDRLEVNATLHATSSVSIGMADNSQSLVVTGGGSKDKKVSSNKMETGGAVAIVSGAPQIDFIDTEAGHQDWSIHVNNGAMYFIREPWNYQGLVLGGDGKVGVGTATLTEQLTVSGNIHCTGRVIANGGLVFWWGPDNQWKVLDNRGSVYGSLAGTVGTTGPSDARLKADVRPIEQALAKVRRLRGTLFRWGEAGLDLLTRGVGADVSAGPGKSDEETRQLQERLRQEAREGLAGEHVGLIAQEVEEVLPEVVCRDREGYRYIRYPVLAAVLVEAIKEQQGLIEELVRKVSGPTVAVE